MPLPTVASLWIGGDLSFLEQVCLKSFVDHGHRAILYTYEGVTNAPEGVDIRDAGQVFPAEEMITHKRTGSLALHSDVFRYRMIERQDAIWVDADVLCFRPWKFDSPYVFGWEVPGQLVGSAVIGLPPDSPALSALNAFCRDEYPIPPWARPWLRKELQELAKAGQPKHVSEMNWGVWGPAALTHFLDQFGELSFAREQQAFFPVHFRDRRRLLKPGYQLERELGDECFGVHLWNRRLRARIVDAHAGIPEPDSFLGRMLTLHEIDPSKAPIKDVPPRDIRKAEEAKRMAEIDHKNKIR